MSLRFRWFVRGFYSDGVKPPTEAGGLAFDVGCGTEHVRDMEIDACKNRIARGTLGRYEVIDTKRPPPGQAKREVGNKREEISDLPVDRT